MMGQVFQNGKKVYILDTKGKDALISMPDAYQSYVFAHGYTIDENKNISWDYGNYYNSLMRYSSDFVVVNSAIAFVYAVRNDIEIFTADINGTAMRKVSAMSKVHTQNRIARL